MHGLVHGWWPCWDDPWDFVRGWNLDGMGWDGVMLVRRGDLGFGILEADGEVRERNFDCDVGVCWGSVLVLGSCFSCAMRLQNICIAACLVFLGLVYM